mgnify:CR=1 FL=1
MLLVEPGQRLGGMSSGGLGQTDIGNKQVVKGLALDFYRRVGAHYGRLESWIFEPSVAENIFKDYIARGNVEVLYDHRIVGVQKQGATIKSISLENVKGEPMAEISAKQFIDCTYEGDLMARSGVSYVVGREDNKVYGEDHNGVQMQHLHQFVDNVDPYVEKGNPASGLLWGISDAALAVARRNGERYAPTVEFVRGDALSAFDALFDEKFDVVVSNPPYIPQQDIALMRPNVVDYEPHMALFVPDNDPLIFYRSIARRSRRLLNTGGRLYFEIYELLADEMRDMLLAEGYVDVTVREDFRGKQRMICAKIR